MTRLQSLLEAQPDESELDNLLLQARTLLTTPDEGGTPSEGVNGSAGDGSPADKAVAHCARLPMSSLLSAISATLLSPIPLNSYVAMIVLAKRVGFPNVPDVGEVGKEEDLDTVVKAVAHQPPLVRKLIALLLGAPRPADARDSRSALIISKAPGFAGRLLVAGSRDTTQGNDIRASLVQGRLLTSAMERGRLLKAEPAVQLTFLTLAKDLVRSTGSPATTAIERMKNPGHLEVLAELVHSPLPPISLAAFSLFSALASTTVAASMTPALMETLLTCPIASDGGKGSEAAAEFAAAVTTNERVCEALAAATDEGGPVRKLLMDLVTTTLDAKQLYKVVEGHDESAPRRVTAHLRALQILANLGGSSVLLRAAHSEAKSPDLIGPLVAFLVPPHKHKAFDEWPSEVLEAALSALTMVLGTESFRKQLVEHASSLALITRCIRNKHGHYPADASLAAVDVLTRLLECDPSFNPTQADVEAVLERLKHAHGVEAVRTCVHCCRGLSARSLTLRTLFEEGAVQALHGIAVAPSEEAIAKAVETRVDASLALASMVDGDKLCRRGFSSLGGPRATIKVCADPSAPPQLVAALLTLLQAVASGKAEEAERRALLEEKQFLPCLSVAAEQSPADVFALAATLVDVEVDEFVKIGLHTRALKVITNTDISVQAAALRFLNALALEEHGLSALRQANGLSQLSRLDGHKNLKEPESPLPALLHAIRSAFQAADERRELEVARAKEEAEQHNTHIDDASVQEWFGALSRQQLRDLVGKVAKAAMVDLRDFQMEPEVEPAAMAPSGTTGGGGAVVLNVALREEVPPSLYPVLRAAIERTNDAVDPSHLRPSHFASAVKKFLAGKGDISGVVEVLGPVAHDAHIFEDLVHLSAVSGSGDEARGTSKRLVTRFKEVLGHHTLTRIVARPLAVAALPQCMLGPIAAFPPGTLGAAAALPSGLLGSSADTSSSPAGAPPAAPPPPPPPPPPPAPAPTKAGAGQGKSLADAIGKATLRQAPSSADGDGSATPPMDAKESLMAELSKKVKRRGTSAGDRTSGRAKRRASRASRRHGSEAEPAFTLRHVERASARGGGGPSGASSSAGSGTSSTDGQSELAAALLASRKKRKGVLLDTKVIEGSPDCTVTQDWLDTLDSLLPKYAQFFIDLAASSSSSARFPATIAVTTDDTAALGKLGLSVKQQVYERLTVAESASAPAAFPLPTLVKAVILSVEENDGT